MQRTDMTISGHVWTTPWLQEESGVRLAVGCKSCVRPVRAAHDRWPWCDPQIESQSDARASSP